MGLTVQQFYDYVDNLTEDKPKIVISDEGQYIYRIYVEHDKYFLDAIDSEDSNKVGERLVVDKQDIESFKVTIMKKIKDIKVLDIHIE